MKKIIIFLIILIATILLSSCSTHRTPLTAGCNCPTNRYNTWNTYSQGGWGNQFWGWNDPFWGWNNSMMWGWGGYPFGMIPRHYIQPNRIQPQQPTRYQRRTSVGERPSRNTQNWSNDVDAMYPRRTPSIPSINAEPSQRTTQPSRIQSTPNGNYQPQQRTTQTPSRNAQPLYRNTTPTTRSRGGNN